MNKRELSQLIHRLRSGTASKEEKEHLERHWQNAMNDDSVVDEMHPIAKDNLKRELYSNISDTIGFKQKAKVTRLNYVKPSLVYKIAASILIICAAGGVWYFNNPHKAVEVAANTVREIRTDYGERLTVTLPDQSSVVLNGNSSLRYNENWSATTDREVWIEGEGFFAVQHTESHQKFVVHTGEGLDVEVLGTKFNVKSREHGSEVLLTEGKVKLNVGATKDNPVYLEPGELATVKENKLFKRVVEDKQYTSWVRSKLFFDKTKLQELALILHDTYGLNVTFENEELKSRQLSGEISSATADDILFAIAETFNIEVTRKADDAVIFSLKQE